MASGQYVRTEVNSGWMRKPWRCPKCKELFPKAAGKGTHLKWCGTQEDNFWRRVDRSSPCWPHNGCTDKWGYAQHGMRGRRHQAHRLAYEYAKGPIPAGMVVMHSCDNPPCCNPAHLSLGTHSTNHADMRAKGRIAKGEQYPGAKMTEEKVRQMRQIRANSGTAYDRLGKRFGVSSSVARAVCLRLSWKHVR